MSITTLYAFYEQNKTYADYVFDTPGDRLPSREERMAGFLEFTGILKKASERSAEKITLLAQTLRKSDLSNKKVTYLQIDTEAMPSEMVTEFQVNAKKFLHLNLRAVEETTFNSVQPK